MQEHNDSDDLERGATDARRADPGTDPYATAPDPGREGPGKVIGDVLRSGIEGSAENVGPRGAPSDDRVTDTGEAPSDPGSAAPGRWGVPDLDNRPD